MNENITPSQYELQEISRRVKENSELLKENNELLKKIRRQSLWGFWIRVVWYIALIGLPFALYFYVLEPYFNAVGSNYEVFKAGINEIPGLRGLGELLDKLNHRSQ
jgi:hypothetical protein